MFKSIWSLNNPRQLNEWWNINFMLMCSNTWFLFGIWSSCNMKTSKNHYFADLYILYHNLIHNTKGDVRIEIFKYTHSSFKSYTKRDWIWFWKFDYYSCFNLSEDHISSICKRTIRSLYTTWNVKMNLHHDIKYNLQFKWINWQKNITCSDTTTQSQFSNSKW